MLWSFPGRQGEKRIRKNQMKALKTRVIVTSHLGRIFVVIWSRMFSESCSLDQINS